MTTIVSVGSAGGRDYSTIQAAWNALPSTLADDYVFELYNDSEFTAGLDTSASAKTIGSYTVTIRPAVGHGFKDHVNATTNALRYDASKGVGISASLYLGRVIDINAQNLILDGLQIKNTYAGSGQAIRGTAANITIKNCIVEGNYDSNAVIEVTGNPCNVINCVVIQRSANVGSTGIACESGKQKGNIIVYGGSGTSSGKGLVNNWNSCTAIGNVVIGFASAFVASGTTFNSASDYNATDLATLGTGQGTHNLTSLTAANQFEAVLVTAGTEDLRVKSGADLIGAGVADADIATDILGRTRDDPPTIGAWEVLGAGGATITLTPDPASVQVGSARTFTATRSAPAGAGGVTYNVSSDNPAVATVPTPQSLTESDSDLTFDATGVSVGTANITITNAADSSETDTVALTVTALTKKLKLLAHADAQGDSGVAGVVFDAPTGSNITGPNKIGEFTGKTFEASLEGGKAVLKVPVADFGGSALTTSDTPVALVRNATNTTGIISCTVIEE
jgi:hypothetical protein